MAQLLTISIGPVVTLVADIDQNKNKMRINKSLSVSTPEAFILDGVITSNEAVLQDFCTGLKSILKQNGIRTKKAIFIINSKRIGTREETLPNLPAGKLSTMIQTNASDYFPVAMDSYQICYKPVEEPKKGDEKVTLNLYAIPNDIVSSYERLADKLGLTIEKLDYKGNTMAQMTKSFSLDGAPTATINIDYDESIFTVVKEGKLLMQRTINYGIGEALAVVQDIIGSESRLEAIKAVKKENFFTKELSEQDQEDLGQSIDMLAGSIRRLLEFYSSKYFDTELSDIYLVGIGDEFAGLDDFLTSSTERTIRKISSDEVVLEDKSASEKRYATVASAAIDPLDIAFESGKKKGTPSSMGASSAGGNSLTNDDANFKPALLVMLVFVVIGLLLTAVGAIGYFSEASKNKDMKANIERLQPAKIVYGDYLTAKIKLNEVMNIEKTTMTSNDGIIDFFEELERKMPTDASVKEISGEGDSIAVTFEALNKEIAGNILLQLRKFDTVIDAETTSVMEDTDVDGTGYVTFTITCTYNPEYTVSAIDRNALESEVIEVEALDAETQPQAAETTEVTDTTVSDATDEAAKKAQEEADKKAAEEAKKKADEEAKKKADEEAKKKADEEAKKKADEEAKKKADEEAKKKADEEAKKKADEEAKKKADEEAKKKADEDAKKNEGAVTTGSFIGKHTTTGSVTVREDANNTSKILGYVGSNQEVNVKAEKNGYYLIDYRGGEGYIIKTYVK